jgi:hypothetical protein
MSKQLVKKNLNVDAARSFVSNVVDDVPYYIFAANADDTTEVITPNNSIESDASLYDNMLFGKRIKSDDIKLSIKRYDWTINEVYDMYDDAADLTDKRFYVAVDTGLETRVYKCLFNNYGAPSKDEPEGTSTESFEGLSDGYVWKYMYSISKFYMNRFATGDYIPVIPDMNVVQAAKPGTIDVIKIDKRGAGYNNYVTGVFNLAEDIRVNGNPLIFNIPNGDSRNNFYVNCMIKITSIGPQNGQYRLITGYTVQAGKKLITIDRPFEIAPLPADSYEIYPNVFVYDESDTATIECSARAIINSASGNSISKIEVLDIGLNYRKASAAILPDKSVGVTDNRIANIQPIISPDKGHGADSEIELMAKYACVSGTFNGNFGLVSSNNTLDSRSLTVAYNTFRTFGLLKEPLYANCELTLDYSTIKGNFSPGETLYRYKPIKLAGTVEVFANSLVLGTNTQIIDSLRENDPVLITNGLTNIFGYANTINYYTPESANTVTPFESFYINVGDATIELTEANCSIYLIEKKYFAECVEYDVNTLRITNVNPSGFEVSSYILGEESWATARMSNNMPYLTIAGRDFSDFEAFNQLTRLVGFRPNTLSTFNENETLIQGPEGNPTATARFHSFESVPGPASDYVYVTNIINTINANSSLGSTTISTIRNSESQTVFEILNKYDGELVRDSGDILYVENINPIRRKNAQTELVKLILEF